MVIMMIDLIPLSCVFFFPPFTHHTDFLYDGLCNALNQLMDNYFLYSRLILLVNPPLYVQVFIHLYIWVIMLLPHLFFYTFAAFNHNLAHEAVQQTLANIHSVFFVSYLIYTIGLL